MSEIAFGYLLVSLLFLAFVQLAASGDRFDVGEKYNRYAAYLAVWLWPLFLIWLVARRKWVAECWKRMMRRP